jgi:adenylate kinase
LPELNLILLGPPGSGKGTQGEKLQEDFALPYYATGDILRAAVKEGTDLGKQAKEFMDRGDLVPDDLIVALIGDELEGRDDESIVLDGFPRTVAQADALAGALEPHGRELSSVVLIDVPDDVVAERISGRGRADDDPETVRERLHVYHDETEPLIEYYEQRDLLRRVDGTGEPDDIAKRLRGALG